VASADEKLPVTCPQCGQQLLVPATALGKQSRCPSCRHVFPLDFPYPKTADDEESELSAEVATNADMLAQQLPPQSHPAPAIPNPYAPPPDAASDSGKYGHGFGWEHRAWNGGMLGGLAVMAIAVVWFFGGLAIGIRFHHPIYLFIIGLVGFFRGLFKGNVTGKE
jgi:hypothetical protein